MIREYIKKLICKWRGHQASLFYYDYYDGRYDYYCYRCRQYFTEYDSDDHTVDPYPDFPL